MPIIQCANYQCLFQGRCAPLASANVTYLQDAARQPGAEPGQRDGGVCASGGRTVHLASGLCHGADPCIGGQLAVERSRRPRGSCMSWGRAVCGKTARALAEWRRLMGATRRGYVAWGACFEEIASQVHYLRGGVPRGKTQAESTATGCKMSRCRSDWPV